MREIIGLAGTFASGKDTAAEYMSKHATHVSTSDIVRAESMEQYGSVDREYLQKVAPQRRKEFGADFFVKKALASEERPLIVSGLRSLGEARAIREAGGMLVYIDADPAIRYERMVSRKRDNEVKLSLDEFIESEKKELYGDINDDGAFNLAAIREMSDVVIENNATLEDFLQAVEKVLNK